MNNVDVTAIGEPVIIAALAANSVFLPPGVNALDYAGTTLKSDVTVDVSIFQFSHGLTDDLTLSVSFPYYNRAETDITFDVIVQANPVLAGIPAGPGYSLADVINGYDGVSLAQNFLNQNIGYDPVAPWTGDPGIGDIDIDLKYRFMNKDKFKAAAGGWVTLPTGEPDDEYNLTDVRYGGGSLNTALYAMVDIVPVKQLPGTLLAAMFSLIPSTAVSSCLMKTTHSSMTFNSRLYMSLAITTAVTGMSWRQSFHTKCLMASIFSPAIYTLSLMMTDWMVIYYQNRPPWKKELQPGYQQVLLITT